jgi:hypothetical protein
MIHKRKAGEVPEGRIPIFDHDGNMRGHVTHAATQSTVSRFIGRHGSTLGTKNGKKAWIGPPPPPLQPQQPQQVNPTAVAAAAQNNQGKLAIAEHQSAAKHKLAIELNQAKGSVTKHPSRPETRARPKR